MQLNDILDDAELRMLTAVEHIEKELRLIRTGMANPALVENIKVEAYGIQNDLRTVANISRPEPRMLLIKPFDANNLKAIEQAIIRADVGLTPNNDGKVIRLNFPVLTEETRSREVQNIHKLGEEAKIAVRNIRRDANKKIDALQKKKEITEDQRDRSKENIQKLTGENEKAIQKLIDKKTKEIQSV